MYPGSDPQPRTSLPFDSFILPRRSGSTDHTDLRTTVHGFTAIAGGTAVVIGCAVLLGWLLDVAVLQSVLPDAVSMKANTAFCFVLTGAALWLMRTPPVDARGRRWAAACVGLAVTVAALTLLEYLTGWNFGIDQAVFRDASGVADNTPYPGRMAQATATAFILAGIAVVTLDVEIRGRHLAQILALPVGVIGLVSLLGFAYGAPSAQGISTLSRLAVHTAALFAALAAGILSARPDHGFVAVMTRDSMGGFVLRRLLSAALVLPIVIGWLRLQGQRAGFYGTEFGLVVMVVAMFAVFTGLIWSTVQVLERINLQRQAAEAELRDSEERFRSTFEQAAVGIAHVSPEGRWLQVNDRLCDIVGYKRDELVSLTFQDITHPTDLDADLDLVRQVLAGHIQTYSLDKRYIRKDDSIVWIQLTVSLVRDTSGAPKYFISVVQDIMARKQAETDLRLLNEQLEQRVVARTAELEAANRELEAFSYSVSHDLRAPLRAISGFARILLEDYAEQLEDEPRRHLDIIVTNTTQMGRLVDDLLTFSRLGRQALHTRPVEPRSLVQSALAELSIELEGRQVELDIGTLPVFRVDPTTFKQVFVNLLSNALKFTRQRSPASIEIGWQATGGDSGVYYVKDNGVGFDMRYADKLFGVFQRLHSVDDFEGTGVGLAIVQRIVHRHGGHVWAEAEVERGATFYFTLPDPAGSLAA